MATSEATVDPAAAIRRTIGRILLGVCFALLTQFMLGMVVNLFITVSRTHPGAGYADYLAGATVSVEWALVHMWPYLALHVLLGLTLVILSLTFFIRGLLATPRNAALLVAGGTGVFGALLAAGDGIYFLIHPDFDVASMLMATGFAIALGAVIVQMYLVRRPS